VDARSARAGWAPEQIGSRIAARFGAGAVSDVSHGTVTADIAPQRWLESLTFARDELGCQVFDWLSAVDEFADGFAVVVHTHSEAGGQHLLLRTRVARDGPYLPSAAKVFGGADVHERETAKQFGIRFAGHPDPPPLPLSADPGVPPPR